MPSLSIESICDDPYGAPMMRALDKLPLKGIDTIQERRIDLSLSNKNLNTAVLFNRITGEERTLYQSEFLYADTVAISQVESKYAPPR